ncbi:MAG TPA: hypothetical protein VEH26_04710, partial [Chthoniobacterales bacterium]|nr:hypothetical protein [Chthoniobacterales bacterium]
MLCSTNMRSFALCLLAIVSTVAICKAEKSVDYQVELGKPTVMTLSGKQVQLVIADLGSEKIQVLFDGGGAGRFQKNNRGRAAEFQKNTGFDPHDTETLLYSYHGSSLYYV